MPRLPYSTLKQDACQGRLGLGPKTFSGVAETVGKLGGEAGGVADGVVEELQDVCFGADVRVDLAPGLLVDVPELHDAVVWVRVIVLLSSLRS